MTTGTTPPPPFYIYGNVPLSFIKPDNAEDLFKSATRILDELMYRRGTLELQRNIYLQMLEGNIDIEAYKLTAEPYGHRSPADVEHFDMYGSIKLDFIGKLKDRDLEYSIEVVNPEFSEEKIEKASSMGASAVMADALGAATEQMGMPLNSLHPDGAGLKPTVQEATRVLTDREEFEEYAHILVQDALKRSNWKDNSDNMIFPTIFAIGAAVGRIDMTGKEPIPVQVPLSEFAYINGEKLTDSREAYIANFDDSSAVSQITYRSIQDIIARYGQWLRPSFVEDLKLLEQGLYPTSKNGQPIPYNLNNPSAILSMFNQRSQYEIGHITSEWFANGAPNFIWASLAGMPNAVGGNIKISDQLAYVKYVTKEDYLVMYKGMLIKGADLDEYKSKGADWEGYPYVDFELPEGRKGHIVSIPKVELWEMLRIGMEIVYARKVPFDTYTPGDPVNTGTPFFGFFKPKSFGFCALTKSYFDTFIAAMYNVRKSVNMTGGKTIVFDVAKKPDNLEINDVIGAAKAGGIALIDSSKSTGSNANSDQFKHMNVIDLTTIPDAVNAFNLAAMQVQAVRSILGMESSQPNQPDKETGQPKIVSNQQRFYFAMYSEFQAMCIEKLINYGKHYWGTGEYARVLVGRDGVQTIKKHVKIPEYYWGVHVTDTSDGAEFSAFLDQTFKFLMSTGAGLEVVPALISAFKYRHNPTRVERIIKDELEKIKQAQQAAAQNQDQSQSDNAVKIAIEKMKSETQKYVADQQLEAAKIQASVKMDTHTQNLEFKENKADLDTQKDTAYLADDVASRENE